MGQPTYPAAQELLMTADSCGSNSYRARLWKCRLQKLANDYRTPHHGLPLPPGTRSGTELSIACFATSPPIGGLALGTREVIVDLIANTQTSKGLTIQADLNVNS